MISYRVWEVKSCSKQSDNHNVNHVALGQRGVEVGVHVLGYDREVDGAAHPQPDVRALLPVVRLLVSHPLRQEGVFSFTHIVFITAIRGRVEG